jgi:undecaprenyl-diphosphatase
MPEWLSVVLLGVIEGVTEFLPISSTGHLIIAERWLGHRSELFNVVIQSGAVLAVLLVFTARVRELLGRHRDPASRDYLLKLAAAFAITGAGGVALKKMGLKLPVEAAPVAWATLIGGGLIFGIEWWLKRRTTRDTVTWPVALAVGAGQLLAAVFPGASRSGTTILTGMAMGVSRRAATEFSFLLGIPTLLAAGGLEIASELRKGAAGNEDWAMVALGTAVSAVTAFGVVKWLLRFVQTHTFVAFGWYRIALGVLILWLAR